MKTGELNIKEIFWDSSARLVCAPELIPAPGQYLLADMPASGSPLAFPIFYAESTPEGFRSAPGISSTWLPGMTLHARGPIGRGFHIPPTARKIALLAYEDSPARLRGLLPFAFKQNAEIVLLTHTPASDLPESVEIQPLQAVKEVIHWADFLAVDVLRENLPPLRQLLATSKLPATQALIRAPMPCGGLAECGVCALGTDYHWKMICKEGPVFKWEEI